MSLTTVSLTATLKKQYSYKLRAYNQVFWNLVFLQLLAVLFSLNGVGMMGSSSESIEVTIHYYSADFVVFFTMIWGLIIAIIITTKAYRNDDFTFVTNRLSHNLSNLLFLLTACLIGGLTAMLSANVIKVITYFFDGQLIVDSTSLTSALGEFILGTFTTSLYIFLCCALGYIVGTLVQIHKVFVVLVPVLFFGGLFLLGVSGNETIVTNFFGFIFKESSILLFMIKVMVTSGLLFASAFLLSNRMEVKQ
ncbi:hypothetical protein V7121_08615 [Neobacillus drentensis]